MLGRTHIMLGLFIGLLFEVPFIVIIMLVFGSLFPDIDKNNSYLGKKFKLSWLFTHRGFFHTIPGLILISALVWFFSDLKLSFWFALGYLSHLVLDSFTKKGINLFYYGKKIIGPVITGGLFDNMLFSILGIANIYLLITTFL